MSSMTKRGFLKTCAIASLAAGVQELTGPLSFLSAQPLRGADPIIEWRGKSFKKVSDQTILVSQNQGKTWKTCLNVGEQGRIECLHPMGETMTMIVNAGQNRFSLVTHEGKLWRAVENSPVT